MSRLSYGIALAAAALFAPASPAQEHPHSHGGTEALGTVNFPTSCRDVAAEFTRAVALLHSFGYEESRLAFRSGRREGSLAAAWLSGASR